ncbi:RING-H2 finger protein ATL39-like [Corylus avellana]|uniref:RING-H2 finger protein ATL39-like n=1 Tax=Corylus avellana TaxID=13451 RepID=UPI00286D01C7|nr:RING-H2 finger protein ATL39-like [Corylus avellana]
MDPPASPATPTGIDPLIFLIVFGFCTLFFCCLLWDCYRCLSSTLAAASSDPFEAEPVLAPVRVPARSKSVPIEQVMPSFVIQIGSNEHEVASKSGGGGGEGEGECCAICLEEFKDGELCRMFPKCNHEFHGPCVNDWLLRQNLTCPLCRNSLEDLVLAINV